VCASDTLVFYCSSGGNPGSRALGAPIEARASSKNIEKMRRDSC